ncbi:MAG: hypothetical protein HC806_09160, partial [Anaerolineae bacterium]|nr:hypothetical protein [Anaerolineae bacterium]
MLPLIYTELAFGGDYMRIYDVTLTISPTLPVWPGDPPVDLDRVSKMED